MTDDSQLLRQYTQDRSEPAFRELVTRHIDLVYSAALRIVCGDAHLAQDVAQKVFADLACKAQSLPDGVLLPGWLYRHACFTASKAVRTEQRRRTREQTAIEMSALTDNPELKWEQIAPHLDDAMNELSESDRDAVVLRFFKRQDFRAVGLALGVSEDTAQKRVSRALDKLRGVLSQRGVALMATTLGAALAAQSVTAAPAGFAATVATASLASAAAAGTGVGLATLKIMAMTKMQVGVVGALVIAGVATPLLLQQQSFNRLHDENVALQQRINDLAQPRDNTEQTPSQTGESRAPNADRLPSELLRLRGEVANLRRYIADLQDPAQAFAFYTNADRKRQEKARQDGMLLSMEDVKIGFPKESWISAGYATPKAAIQSMLWAQSQGDVKTLFANFTPEALKWKFEHQWKDKTESEIAAELRDAMSKITDFHVMMQMLPPDKPDTVEIWFVTQGEAPGSSRNGSYSMRKIGDEWKCCSPGFVVETRGPIQAVPVQR